MLPYFRNTMLPHRGAVRRGCVGSCPLRILKCFLGSVFLGYGMAIWHDANGMFEIKIGHWHMKIMKIMKIIFCTSRSIVPSPLVTMR